MVHKLALVSSSILFAIVLLFAFLGEIRSERSNLAYSYLAWSESPHLPTAVGNNQLLLWKNYVYVVGGSLNDEDPSHDAASNMVFRAPIQADGSLGNWVSISSVGLPALKISGSDSSRSGWLYITGGQDGSKLVTTTYYGKETQPEVMEWYLSRYDFDARGWHTTVIVQEGTRDEIYTIGGLGYTEATQTVVYSTLNPDTGELDGPWTPTSSLIPQRFGHASVTYKSWIYVIGGRTTDTPEQPVTNSVKYAKANNGIQGTWTDGEPLPLALAHLKAVVTNDGRIFVIGGRDRTSLSNEVYSATIDIQTGELSKWTAVPELELPLDSGLHSHSSIFAPNGSIYVVGGQDNNFKNGVNNHYVDTVFHIPILAFTKSANPPGPVHEGDIITYTIAYTNTGLITQTGIVITDIIPYNTELVDDSILPNDGVVNNGVISWTISGGSLSVGQTGSVSFRVRVRLLSPSPEVSVACPTEEPPTPTPTPADYIVPISVACDTTQFWANGVTYQSSSPPVSHTIHIQIPPGTNPTALWLLMKGTGNVSPTVGGKPALLLQSSPNNADASLWTADITPAMIEDHQVTVVTYNPRQLNAVYLFNENDPPFDESKLSDIQSGRQIPYTLEIPTIATQTIDVILPLMNVTYWTDDLQPNPYPITVTVQFDDQLARPVVATMPNMGNGLLMTHFPFTIGPLGRGIDAAVKILTVTVDTQNDIYTLGPRVCRPVRIENTAWLCSQQAGCISASATNEPPRPMIEGVYLPVIQKTSP